MLLVAIGSGTAPQNPYGSYGGCDDWLAEQYLYFNPGDEYKAAYRGNGVCWYASGKSQKGAINAAKVKCEKRGPYCYLLAAGNQVHGYLNGYAQSRYSGQYLNITQNYTGNNNICNSSAPGGCAGAFKP